MKNKLSIVIISDTHNKHEQLILTEADVIIHCGDFTSVGKEYEIRNFMKWYSGLNLYKYKICCAGNHDILYEKNRQLAKSLIPSNIIYLEDSGIEIEGIKFYGTPVQKIFYNWAFNRSESTLIKHWQAIPDNTDVLITHSPPYMIGDYVPRTMQHEGSPSLYEEVTKRIKPKIHCYGHLHSGYGIHVIGETTFINASNLDEGYNCVNNPIIIEI
jgi:Icc-related predicted phosphoesterase